MQRHVLIVEDDPDLSFVFTRAFQIADFRVRAVVSATKALAELQQYSPDLLILDVGLPEMSGLELLRQVRKLHPDMKVMIVTADALVANTKEVQMADQFLLKPVDLSRLVAEANQLQMAN